MKAINTILDVRKPEILISGLESFTAILRNKTEVKNVDVQLYLDDFEKLLFKMEYIDAKTLDIAIIKKHRAKLVALQRDFYSDDDSRDFKYFIKWAYAFADHAILVLGASTIQKEIVEVSKELENMKMKKFAFV